MAQDRYPENPDRPDYRTSDSTRPPPFDSEFEADPELVEGPASGTRIAVFAVAIAVVLAAVFYGLNSSTTTENGPNSTAQNAQTQNTANNAKSPPGVRDVTPGPNNATTGNTAPGVTTGAAPSKPAPSSAPAVTPAPNPAPSNSASPPPSETAPAAPSSNQ